MIPPQLQEGYADIRPKIEALKGRVDSVLQGLADKRNGEYLSRIKQSSSIFEKLVRGEYPSLVVLEDLLATMIVVPQLPLDDDISTLKSELEQRFSIVETRTARTRRPAEFIYDDLHFILRLKDHPLLLDKTLLSWTFELQVKSFLQFGWSRATHDAIYKAKMEQWNLSRVGAQTKAMVEVADLTLARPQQYMPVDLEQNYLPIEERREIVTALGAWWRAPLPADRRRLGVFAQDLLRLSKWSLDRLQSALASERAGELAAMRSLAVQQALVMLCLEEVGATLVDRARRKKHYFVISAEMESLSKACRDVPLDLRVSFT